MTRDYKHRANQNKKKPQQTFVAWWKWLLIIVLIAVFVYFLFFLSHSLPEIKDKQTSKKISISQKATKPKVNIPKRQNLKPKQPRFDFYTILPETEVVVPDYEIKTRSREEQFGKGKPSKYVIQVGAFREPAEADKLRARLALLGIESHVEKANVGNVIWNRVKMGPFSSSSSVSAIKTQLSQNNIDVIVTEIKK
ncbi:MAG: SPOR domain-containing protein [Methylococcales symbiont of Hymedesmia sp. n. MRB-2018]|nr:MAG: SPOR domain-containing protein [Methylococcales symbiont of Hymedesmia sp. n. MRB-2018]KAF3984651.1 MAG: SPOR domain-containing protein [Methylococcales symbiont of Hymedesmia sp. n. MRB-2018]